MATFHGYSVLLLIAQATSLHVVRIYLSHHYIDLEGRSYGAHLAHLAHAFSAANFRAQNKKILSKESIFILIAGT